MSEEKRSLNLNGLECTLEETYKDIPTKRNSISHVFKLEEDEYTFNYDQSVNEAIYNTRWSMFIKHISKNKEGGTCYQYWTEFIPYLYRHNKELYNAMTRFMREVEEYNRLVK